MCIIISGIQIHDTCEDDELLENHLFHVIGTSRMIGNGRDSSVNGGPQILGKQKNEQVWRI